jgi:uncharacterized membrane protein HdeD (DUF308 family)
MPSILAPLYQRTWWSLLIRGLVAVLFGILAITWPDRILEFIVTLLGIFVLVVGILATVGALMHRAASNRWMLVLIPGLIGIIIGIITIVWPAFFTVVIFYLIAVWALVYGIMEIYNALRLRKDVEGEWMPILVGIVSVIFGLVLLIKPLTVGATVTWVIGLCVLVLGVLWLILAFRARGWQQHSKSEKSPPDVL